MIVLLLIITAAIVVVILLSPVSIRINSVGSRGKIDGTFSIGWLILSVRYALKDKQIEIFILGRKIHSSPYKEKPAKPVKPAKIKKPEKVPPVGDVFNLSGPMLRLFKDIVNAFRLRYFDVDITFGLNDPANTGILTGFLHAVQGSLQTKRHIRWTADFTRSVLEWDLMAEAAITPIRIFPPIARFIANRQVLRSARMIFGM